jgi:hypothetical protein
LLYRQPTNNQELGVTRVMRMSCPESPSISRTTVNDFGTNFDVISWQRTIAVTNVVHFGT